MLGFMKPVRGQHIDDKLYEYAVVDKNTGIPELIVGPVLIFAPDLGTAKRKALEKFLGAAGHEPSVMEKLEVKVREFT